jgi:hypothetical protein
MKNLVLLVAVILVGCSSVDKSAVRLYSDSFTPVCSAIKTVSKNSQQMEDDRNVYKYSKPQSTFSSTFIALQDKKHDDAFYELQTAIKKYNTALLCLASDDPINEQYINSLTINDAHYGVFSMPFLYGAKKYVQNKNFNYFSAAILSNQPNIEAYAAIAKDQLKVVNSSLVKDYVEIANYLNPTIYAQDKVATVAYLVKANNRLNKSKELIAYINEYYRLLPLAHEELRKAEKKGWYVRGHYYYIYKLHDVSNKIKELQ